MFARTLFASQGARPTRIDGVAPPRTYDVIILGAGAAGLMAAIESGKRDRRTLVLDHADRAGAKILISGGGRANFTNLHTTPENYLSENPHFARSALARYTPQDFIALVEKHRIPYHEKTLGQLFCDRSARDIVSLLTNECAAVRAEIQLETRIQSIAASQAPHARFQLETSRGRLLTQSLVIATGGLSIPKMGATALGYDLARQFGLAIVEPRPALVPFTLNPQDHARWCDLSGVSTEAIATTNPASASRNRKVTIPTFREKILITHRGLSGPAILQISSYWRPGQPVTLDLAPDREVFAALLTPNGRRDPAAAASAIRSTLPSRWAERWLTMYPPVAAKDLSNQSIAALEDQLHHWQIIPAGTEGYAKAEVTAGGVSTAELNPKTLEANKVPGLHFIGEVVDVTGWLGGYNFQWAWASGYCAGQSA
jgi:predicted Rossmann fold flavoprotein